METTLDVETEEPQPAPARSRRRLVAGLLAVVGAAAIVAGLMTDTGDDPTSKSGRSVGSAPGDVAEPLEGDQPPTTGPGGVGEEPHKTGLPVTAPPEGGKVRTGTEQEGCFETMAEYLEEWHSTGEEPEPCFTAQPPSNQDQPEGVRRTYNGQNF